LSTVCVIESNVRMTESQTVEFMGKKEFVVFFRSNVLSQHLARDTAGCVENSKSRALKFERGASRLRNRLLFTSPVIRVPQLQNLIFVAVKLFWLSRFGLRTYAH
jgi:hypothetical protein